MYEIFFLISSVMLLSLLGPSFLGLSIKQAQADEIYTFILKKQDEKRKNRWSLQEWIETRDRMQLMDLWLAIHSPSPYENFITGNYQLMTRGIGGNTSGAGAQLGAYASIFGLEADYDGAPDSNWSARFHLRVFGFQQQGTNITLGAGVRSHLGSETFRNPVISGNINLYLAKFFSIHFLVRQYFESTTSNFGTRYKGNRLTPGAAIDFNFFQVYGDYILEKETATGGSGVDKSYKGVEIGGRLFL